MERERESYITAQMVNMSFFQQNNAQLNLQILECDCQNIIHEDLQSKRQLGFIIKHPELH